MKLLGGNHILVREFNKITENLSNDFIIKISNYSKDYTLKEPSCSEDGTLHFDESGIDFFIDWDSNSKVTLGYYRDMLIKFNINDSVEIRSMDEDDLSTINFKYALITEVDGQGIINLV